MAIVSRVNDLEGVNGPDQQQLKTNPPNGRRSLCESIFKGHLSGTFTSYSQAYGLCDEVFFLKSALQNASEVTPQALLEGVDRLGPQVFANAFFDAKFAAPNHYDGASSVRVMNWNQGAQEWQYISPPIAMP